MGRKTSKELTGWTPCEWKRNSLPATEQQPGCYCTAFVRSIFLREAKRIGGKGRPSESSNLTGVEACSCGKVDRFPVLNGKSQCSKRWCGRSVRALLLQNWCGITFAKIIHWNFNDKLHLLMRKWQKLVEKNNQAHGESEVYFHFWLHNCEYLHMNRARLLFLEFDWSDIHMNLAIPSLYLAVISLAWNGKYFGEMSIERVRICLSDGCGTRSYNQEMV